MTRPIAGVGPGAVLGASRMLDGCITAASGVVKTPPGVNQCSFTQCLAEIGFFTDTALIGGAEKGYEARRGTAQAADRRSCRALGPGKDYLIAQTLWAGLLPHQQHAHMRLVAREEVGAGRTCAAAPRTKTP